MPGARTLHRGFGGTLNTSLANSAWIRGPPKLVAVGNLDRLVFVGLYRLGPKVLGGLLLPETVIH
jgi:hypothetical protein